MVIGAGSASWQIVRDLAMRLPFMVLPKWLKSRTLPIGLDDVVKALVAAADLPLAESEWFDLPGPEILSGRQILDRIAALRGRHIRAIEVPLLTPRLSALWLRLVTRTDFRLARELVLGLGEDLLPKDGRFWKLIDHRGPISFDQAAARALAAEADVGSLVGRMATKSRTAWRILILPLAIATWLGCFVVLARWGSWTAFALAGSALAAFACGIDPALPALLRPSFAKLGVGLVMGAVMVVLTHAVFAPLSAFQPGIRAATLKLYELLNGVGLSPLARAALVVVVATSEEILFRGTLADLGLDGLDRWRHPLASWPRLSRVAVLAACYAVATLPLGSPLLAACAFLCGLAWGGLRVATRSLVPPIVAHIAWDLGVLLVWPLV